MRLENYMSDNKKKLEICYKELGKVKNICPCRKSSFKNYDQTLNEKWHDCWNVIHEFPLNLPCELCKSNSKQIYDFFNLEVGKISCFECRKHYFQYIKEHPIEDCKNCCDLFEWTVNLHNDVNNRNKKHVYSRKEIYDIFK